MVVGYNIPFFFYEITSVAQVIGCIPYFPVDAFGKLFGVSFVEESGVFGAYHIKKDAETRIISLYMGILCPVLRTERPILFLMVACIGLVRAVVFGIYQYDVDAQLRLLFVQLAGYFEQYAYPARTVVGAENGCVTVFLVRVGICPWTAVPMREQHDAFLRFGLVAADDVAGF